jgi:predicted site-specific integrase-resolvase
VDRLLTKKDVAQFLQITPQTVDEYVKRGVITPVKKLDCIRFNSQHIEEIAETKIERFSPIERKRIEKERDEWKTKYEELKGCINNILPDLMKTINL